MSAVQFFQIEGTLQPEEVIIFATIIFCQLNTGD